MFHPILEKFRFLTGFGVLTSAFLLTNCGKGSSTGANLPLVTPPVRAVTPVGLKGTYSVFNRIENIFIGFFRVPTAKATNDLDVSELKNRFFSGGGPTDILGSLLPTLDSSISGINSMTQNNNSACLTQSPIPFTIQPFGQSETLYAQCYQQFGTNPNGAPGGFMQFGVKDGVSYLYQANGAEWIAAIVHSINGTSQYSVQAWIALGYTNGTGGSSGCGAVSGYGSAWDTCSYGVMQLSANQQTKKIELAVAGMGFGYCGAQLASDGANIYAAGSSDMGQTCGPLQTNCLSASDVTTPATCASDQTTFSLPPLGRTAANRSTAAANSPANNGSVITTWGASNYPALNPTPATLPSGSPSIQLDGTASDALHSRFGPSTPTTGVGSI